MANAFDISLGGAQMNGRFLMGSPMRVDIQWRLDAMRDLTFKVTNCHVSHGDLELDIISRECYSQTVNAQPVAATQFSQGTSFYYALPLLQNFAKFDYKSDVQAMVWSCAHVKDNIRIF